MEECLIGPLSRPVAEMVIVFELVGLVCVIGVLAYYGFAVLHK